VGEAQLQRQAFGVSPLGADGRVGRTAPHREVVAGHDDRAAVDLGHAAHEVRRQERGELAVVVVGADSRDRADLVERAGVDDEVHPLADRELAELVLAGDLVGAAHLLRQFDAQLQLVDLGLPAHGRGT
jgi:hypothetical protein